MAGRPRKPAALKARDGDTRKVGALRHAEEIANAFIARRGRPPLPASLKERDLSRESTEAEVASEIRREAARVHWEYICNALGSEGLLCPLDGGVLEGLAWNHALQMECFAAGQVGLALKLQAEYRATASVVGLHEVARAKMPKPKSTELSTEEAALAAPMDDLDDSPMVQ